MGGGGRCQVTLGNLQAGRDAILLKTMLNIMDVLAGQFPLPLLELSKLYGCISILPGRLQCGQQPARVGSYRYGWELCFWQRGDFQKSSHIAAVLPAVMSSKKVSCNNLHQSYCEEPRAGTAGGAAGQE